MASYYLARVSTAEQGAVLKLLLEGKSYMKLRVLVCPGGGQFQVVVETSRPDTTEQELTDMVASLLADHAIRSFGGSR